MSRIDLSERILWRAKRNNMPSSYYFDDDHSMAKITSYDIADAKRPILVYYFDKSSYTAICAEGILFNKEGEATFYPFQEIEDLHYDRHEDNHDHWRIFLEGPNVWVNLPTGKDFFRFANTILMTIRMTRKS